MRLLDAVFENFERLLLQIGHQLAVLVQNAHRQHHQARAYGEKSALQKSAACGGAF